MSRFISVDPLASKAPGWTPYRYGFNNPLTFVDSDGLFETKADAKKFRKQHNITGSIRQEQGVYFIQGTGDNDGQQYSFGAGAAGFVGEQTSNAYTRSISFAGALGGGIGFELGYAKDNYGDAGIYFRFSGEVGLGGGWDLFSMQELVSSTDTGITLDKMRGNDTEFNIDLGPIGLMFGGDASDPRPSGTDAFTQWGDQYTIDGFSATEGIFDLKNIKKMKLKPKLRVGGTMSFGQTSFLFRTDK